MEEQRRLQSVEQYDDMALSQLMDEYANEEGKLILQEFEQAKLNGTFTEIPDELDAKCRKLIDKSLAKYERQTWLKSFSSHVAKTAVGILVMLGLATATVLSVDALRVPVLNLLMDQSGKYSLVLLEPISSTEKNNTDTIVERFESFIPAGYQVTSRNLSESNGIIVCKNSDNQIIYLQFDINESAVNVDAEELEYTAMNFGENSAAFWEKRGYHLVWLDSKNLKFIPCLPMAYL